MWSIIGHERAVAVLERSLTEGRLAHAYLITGPADVGKRRLALDLAKAVNCTGSPAPCSGCRACRRIEAGRHSDVEVIGVGGLCDQADHDHARDGSKDIKICQIRRIERVIALRPFEGRTRVIVIDPASALNAFAADALLKTLEEPPAQVLLLLLAADAAELPETVVSRARRIALGPVPLARIREELARQRVEPAHADLLARLSGGRIGWALRHGSDGNLLREREQRLQQLEALLGSSAAERMKLAGQLAARFTAAREEVFAQLDLWLGWGRDLLLVAEGCNDLVANCDRLSSLRAVARLMSPGEIVQALNALRACRRQLGDNANVRLALEVLVLRLPGPVKREEAGSEWAATRR